MAGNETFGALEVMDVILYDMKNKRPVIFFDSLKTSSISVTSEKVYARGGKGNAKLITWEVNKEATLTIEDALLSPKSMELISGNARIVGSQSVSIRQFTEFDVTDPAHPEDKGSIFPLTADEDGVINLAYEPDCSLSEVFVYKSDDDCGEPFDMTTATISGRELTVIGAADQEVIVYYSFAAPSDTETYIIDASHFSGTYRLVGNTVIRNRNTLKDEAFQVELPNLKWSSNLTLDFKAEGDPSPTSFECEIMKPANSDTLIKLTKYN